MLQLSHTSESKKPKTVTLFWLYKKSWVSQLKKSQILLCFRFSMVNFNFDIVNDENMI